MIMNITNSIRTLAVAAALVPGAMVATAMPSSAQVAISISVGIAPPVLPVYEQPPCPAPGYLWTPGYWGYNTGYYWVPGAWVQPPQYGVLWTPPYWGYAGGLYGFHAGYWGPRVGFYGGINYGFGYGGVGFGGGYWQGNAFRYNSAVANVNTTYIHNTYVRNVSVTNTYYGRTSYNGGPYGVRATPNGADYQALRERRFGETAYQQQQFHSAQSNRGQYASATGNRPGTLALQNNRSGFGYANEVNTRQGNQQSRISAGIRGGGITPGEAQNLENRDNSIHGQAQSERYANGGSLTAGERAQINQRQNNVSRSIYNDRHNANNDAAAAYRNGETRYQERGQAQGIYRQQRPLGPQTGYRGVQNGGSFPREAPGSGGYRAPRPQVAPGSGGYSHAGPAMGGGHPGGGGGPACPARLASPRARTSPSRPSSRPAFS